jgi:RNA polymerase sigma-70 factor (ECF subfamily)
LPGPAEQAVADAHRREWGFVRAATVRVTGDLGVAEEAVQDAYVRALSAWARDGVPDNPAAWLTIVARRLALNAMQRRRTLERKLPLLAPDTDVTDEPMLDEPETIPDDRLRLIFTCCHPALSREAQIALTLRMVCGVATPDIAHALLVSEPTMAARLTRARKKIVATHIPFAVPGPDALAARVDTVLTVVHLLFTTGHAAPGAAADLEPRALELARLLVALLPDDREARGLLALLLVTRARHATRVDPAGMAVLLADQDRTRWDRAAIAEGHDLVVGALTGGAPGRFALQAAIAALHAQARSWATTDWPQILTLYDALLAVWPSPVVALNRAVALSMVAGPQAGLDAIDDLADVLAGYRYLPAARAGLLRRLGRHDEAAAAYRAALALTEDPAERAFLQGRLRP